MSKGETLMPRREFLPIIVALTAALTGCRAADYEIVKADRRDPESPAITKRSVLPDEGGPSNQYGHANGYEAVFENAAPHFRAFPPLGGNPCGKRVLTSRTARAHRCQWATNASPFNMESGACDCGIAISDGVAYGTGGWDHAQFGVTQGGDWVIGTIDASVATALNVTQSINGHLGWLVRDGAVALVSYDNSTVAPRTAIGVRRDGRLLSLEVDGCEPQKGCSWSLGKTLHAMAELLVQRGALHAINLDGGGSSAVYSDGEIINHPTDADVWRLRDERAVTTIACVV